MARLLSSNTSLFVSTPKPTTGTLKKTSLLIDKVDPDTRITIKHLEKKLQSLTLGDHRNSVISLVDAMEGLRLKIKAEKEME